MGINSFCGHLRPRALVRANARGHLLENNKASQLDPLPVIMATGDRKSQQRIRTKQLLSSKMRYRPAEKCPLSCQKNCSRASVIWDYY